MQYLSAMLLAILALQNALAAPPHILSIIIDDLGWHDTAIRNNESWMTENIAGLAREGIVLGKYVCSADKNKSPGPHHSAIERHHTYMYCSPTRRSFLSGRFPNHITGDQAPICSNYLPLNLTLLPAKLKEAEYETHMIG